MCDVHNIHSIYICTYTHICIVYTIYIGTCTHIWHTYIYSKNIRHSIYNFIIRVCVRVGAIMIMQGSCSEKRHCFGRVALSFRGFPLNLVFAVRMTENHWALAEEHWSWKDARDTWATFQKSRLRRFKIPRDLLCFSREKQKQEERFETKTSESKAFRCWGLFLQKFWLQLYNSVIILCWWVSHQLLIIATRSKQPSVHGRKRQLIWTSMKLGWRHEECWWWGLLMHSNCLKR